MDMKLNISAMTVGYHKNVVLRDINLQIQQGEFVALIGANGSGKSTMINAISGILPTLSGSILIDGTDINRLKPREKARKVAVVPQTYRLSFAYKVMDVVLMARYSLKIRTPEAVRPYMEATGIWALRDKIFNDLSGGEKQRVMIAAALAQEADLLLLDEPTSDLDIFHQAETFELIEQLRKTKDITILAVLHDLNMAALYCDRIIGLKNGELLLDGTPLEVISEENLAKLFGAKVEVVRRKDCNRPYILQKKGGV